MDNNIRSRSNGQTRGRRSAHDSRQHDTNKFRLIENVILPTHSLSKEANQHFQALIQSREMETWSKADIILATQLAQLLDHCKHLEQHILQHGMITKDRFGIDIVSPQYLLLEKLQKQTLQFYRALGLSAAQKGMMGQDQKARNNAERAIRESKRKADESDGVLA